MQTPGSQNDRKEIAYYYPDPMWGSGDWIKNLILFFDGIALLVPRYLREKPGRVDPAIVAGLEQHGLLHIIEPEDAVDKAATEELATRLMKVIESGVLDSLGKDTAFHAISRSRLGYFGDETLARSIFRELEKRGLAQDAGDGHTLHTHPQVRTLILVLLAQILRPYGEKINADLSPATDVPHLVAALSELLRIAPSISMGRVIEFDLAAVSVNLGPVPFDEVLDYRKQHLAEHRRYCTSVRRFAAELSAMPDGDQDVAFAERQAELDDIAADLRSRSRKVWKKPTAFSLSLVGAAVSFASGNEAAALLAVGALALNYRSEAPKPPAAYSYLFNAETKFPS
jgi:hypothetical protein